MYSSKIISPPPPPRQCGRKSSEAFVDTCLFLPSWEDCKTPGLCPPAASKSARDQRVSKNAEVGYMDREAQISQMRKEYDLKK